MKKKRNKRAVMLQRLAVLAVVAGIIVVFICLFSKGNSAVDDITVVSTEQETIPPTVSPTEPVEPSNEPVWGVGDPDNYIYPFNTMSADWGVEVYEQGYKYFEIPDEYVRSGGCFPEVVQVYLWCLCREREELIITQ